MKRELRKGCLSVLFAIGVISGLTAQKVTSVNGRPVIDLSELDPVGAVLTKSGAYWRMDEINKITPNNKTLSTGQHTDTEWNAKMSPMFQVMKKDLGSPTDWASAYRACRAYKGENGDGTTSAGDWRLPTQRELQMIWVLLPDLNGKATPFAAQNYWTCTELYQYIETGDQNMAWFVNFSNGIANYVYGKNAAMYVRCIRDL